jgi:hypothetical protein
LGRERRTSCGRDSATGCWGRPADATHGAQGGGSGDACAGTGARRCAGTRRGTVRTEGWLALEADVCRVWGMAAEVGGSRASAGGLLSRRGVGERGRGLRRPSVRGVRPGAIRASWRGRCAGGRAARCAGRSASRPDRGEQGSAAGARCRRRVRSGRRRGLHRPSPIPGPRGCGRGLGSRADLTGQPERLRLPLRSAASRAESRGIEAPRAAGWCWSAGS